MRTTPALALVAAFLASSAVSALTLPQAGLEHAPVQLHRRTTCHAGQHHKKHHHHHDHHDKDDKDAGAAPPAQPPAAQVPASQAPAPQPDASTGGDAPAPQPAVSSAGGDAPTPQPVVPGTGGDGAPTPQPNGSDASAAQPSVPQPWTADTGADDGAKPKKMHKKKHKGKCALKHNGQDASSPAPQDGSGGVQSGAVPPVTGAPSPDQGADGSQVAPVDANGDASNPGLPNGSNGDASKGGLSSDTNGDTSKGGLPLGNDGADEATKHEDYSGGQQPGTNPGGASNGGGGQASAGGQTAPVQHEDATQQGGDGISPGGASGKSWGSEGSESYAGGSLPGAGQPGSGDGSSGQGDQTGGKDQTGDQDKDGSQDQDADNTQPEGYSPDSKGQTAKEKTPVQCKGVRGSTTLPSNGKVKYNWFSPDLIHHGPGTQFGDPGLWNGGACMFDGMPHHNLPSVAMDQTFFQDGLACGTCVEIGSTSASLFSNNAVWAVETPKKGTLPAGKKTIAIVSDLCPGVDQCYSGLDMHMDAWNSVTNNASGSKLPINWKFVNCKEAFEKSNSGITNMEVHWRQGAAPGFFEVQIRGNHEAVVRVEMKYGSHGWRVATHKDSAWWQWVLPQPEQQQIKPDSTAFTFRITDWQGETITADKATTMGTDLWIESNFDRVADLDQA